MPSVRPLLQGCHRIYSARQKGADRTVVPVRRLLYKYMSNQQETESERQIALQELEVSINDLDSSNAEPIVSALKSVPGIRAARVVTGGIFVSYQPVGITPEQIRTEIERAGYTVDGMQGGHQSPLSGNPPQGRTPVNHMGQSQNVHPDPGGHKGQ